MFHISSSLSRHRSPAAVVFLAFLMVGALCIDDAGAAGPKTRPANPNAEAFRAGHIDAPQIDESSGIIASRIHAGVFWTHNDSGNPPEIFAITREGRLLQAFTVDQKNHDWEDIAYDGKGRILIADIGNNRHDRQETFVHAVAEPDPNLPPQKRKESKIKAVATWTLKYPAKPFDAESLFVIGEKAYVISKLLTLEKAMLYSFDLDEKKPMQTLKAVFDLPIRMPATGADVSQDKKWLCVMTIAGPYLFRIDGDIAKAEKASPAHVFYTDKNMEACTFVPEGILATTEGRDVLLFKWKDFGVKPE